MRRPWIGLAVFIVLVVAFLSAAWFWGGNGDWGSHHDQVVRVVNADGTAIGPGNMIIVESRRGGPFFPFFFLMRRAFWGPRRSPWTNPGAGQNGTSTPPAWFDEWHRGGAWRDDQRHQCNKRRDHCVFYPAARVMLRLDDGYSRDRIRQHR